MNQDESVETADAANEQSSDAVSTNDLPPSDTENVKGGGRRAQPIDPATVAGLIADSARPT